MKTFRILQPREIMFPLHDLDAQYGRMGRTWAWRWSALANKFATTVSPIIRSKAVMYTDAIKNYLIGLHGPRYYKRPDLSAIPDSFVITDEESVKKLNTFLWQFRRPTFNNNTKYAPSLVRDIGLFGRGYLVPRGPLLLRGQTGYVRLPGPILKFLEDYLSEASTSDYQKNTVRLENLFAFIRAINAGMRESRFFVNYDESETLRSLFRSKILKHSMRSNRNGSRQFMRF